jgi:hypothetical protein
MRSKASRFPDVGVLLIDFIGLPGRGIRLSQDCCLRSTTQTRRKRRHTFMLRVGFEPTISVFKRSETVHIPDRVATVISLVVIIMAYLTQN